MLSDHFNCVLSGHSHRSVLYQRDPSRNYGYGMSSTSYDMRDLTGIDASLTKFIVSGCGGPTAVQNWRGELNGQGLDYPNGTVIIGGAGSEQIQVLHAKTPQAKPRFCVVMDFFDLTGPGFFEEVPISSYHEPYIFKGLLNEKLPKWSFISHAALDCYSESGQYLGKVRFFVDRFNDILSLQANSNDASFFDLTRPEVFFLSIHFNNILSRAVYLSAV